MYMQTSHANRWSLRCLEVVALHQLHHFVVSVVGGRLDLLLELVVGRWALRLFGVRALFDIDHAHPVKQTRPLQSCPANDLQMPCSKKISFWGIKFVVEITVTR